MKLKNAVLLLVLTVLSTSTVYAEYSGMGGMAAFEISPEVYEYHYENGFTGEDAMGWDPNLQYAWSRAGAALTCNIDMNKELILKNLSTKYGNDPFIHDLNGVTFHHLQSKKINNFCTKERADEIKKIIPKLEVSDFPQNF